MNDGSFVHLHNHSSFSELDGAAQVDAYVEKAARFGQPAIASSDHGNLFALPDYERACNNHGLKFIPGIEAYQARESQADRPKSRRSKTDSDDDSSTGKLYFHTLVFAKNQTGYTNLCKLSSNSWEEGFYYKPRIDWETLDRYSEGLMGTSACLGGIILQEIMKGNLQAADDAVANYVDILGKDNFFIELQDHGIPEQNETNPVLIDIAKRFGLRLVATNDNHYVDYSDFSSHDALLCCQTKSLVSETDRFKFSSDQHYLKDSHDMRYLFRDIPEACNNTLWVAEQVEPIKIIQTGQYHLPHFPLPWEFNSENDYLRHLVLEGAKARYPNGMTEEIVTRIEYELNTMATAEMSGYFLVMWDILNFCRREGIMTGHGRGSAAGSIIAYTLGITKVCPIEHKLIFERFYNPDRKGLPDIDLDIDTRYRENVMNYCSEKYGSDHVAQIITFGLIKAKSALKDSARVLGYQYTTGVHLSSLVPPDLFGRAIPLKEVVKATPEPKWKDQWEQGNELRKAHADPATKEIVETALGLEGLVRSTGIHAAAYVITPDPIVEYLPTTKKGKKPTTTSFSMNDVEALGLVKMDFLGLENLDIIADTAALAGLTEDDLPTKFDDPLVYQLLTRGETIGVFQLESDPMRSLMRHIKPEKFSDIAALIALYRPGPMGLGLHEEFAKRKNGLSPVSYVHADAEDILKDTYGIMVYQEQLMAVSRTFAGFSAGEADDLRKATGKKILAKMKEQEAKFKQGCLDNGYSQELADRWWQIIEPFGSYGFNLAHSVGYGATTYITAWLKVHHPVEYLASILTAKKDKLDSAGIYLAECIKMGIDVLPPDINASEMNFSPEDGNIRFGLSAIRGMGDESAMAIISEREAKGLYKDYKGFRSRVSSKDVNKGKAFSLVAAGAMDGIASRGGLLENFDTVFESTRVDQKNAEAGLESFLSLINYEESIDIPEIELKPTKIRELEREYLGISITSNPLIEWQKAMENNGTHTVGEAVAEPDDTPVVVCGVVSDVKPWTTKKGDKMATLEIQDFTGTVGMLVFARLWAKVQPKLDQCVIISGKMSDEGNKILGQNIQIVDASHKHLHDENFDLHIMLLPEDLQGTAPAELSQLLGQDKFAGKDKVFVHVEGSEVLDLGLTVHGENPLLRSSVRRIFNREVC